MMIVWWLALGIFGMLMATWAFSKDPKKDVQFNIGHVLFGAVLGPVSFVVGLFYAATVTEIMKYVTEFLSLPLFTWRNGNVVEKDKSDGL
jgi:hypothetical protein